MSDVETFYCLIVGSRSFSDSDLFVAKCDLLLRNWGSVVIVSGGARGADALAKRYAVDRGYCYMEFPADWDTYGRRAGYIRNRAMHEYISNPLHLVKIHLIVFQQFAHLLDSHRGHAHVATDDDGLQRLAGGYFEHLIVCQCEILIGRQSAFTCRRQSVIVTLHEA